MTKLSNPLPSTSGGALTGTLLTLVTYLASKDFNLLFVDWSFVGNLMGIGGGVSGAIGYATSNKNKSTTSGFTFSARSITNLAGVHQDLVQITTRALELSPHDFAITSGVRTPEQQKALYDSGISPVKNSRHLYGYAVDIGVWIGNDITWDIKHYKTVSRAFKQAAAELGISIEWGGDWDSVDGVHFELAHSQYPDTVVGLA